MSKVNTLIFESVLVIFHMVSRFCILSQGAIDGVSNESVKFEVVDKLKNETNL